MLEGTNLRPSQMLGLVFVRCFDAEDLRSMALPREVVTWIFVDA